MSKAIPLSIRAIRTFQAGVPVYTFFLPGEKVLELADISRLGRSEVGLEGFQRGPVQRHIASMVDYLNRGDVLFPNAILLALSPRAHFKKSRGPTPPGLVGDGEPGVLELPALTGNKKWAWIVDGQQRSMALAKAERSQLAVPVVAFVSDDLQVHREQFVLVNKARPLSRRLVDELLPEIDASRLPADMAVRQIPSALVNRLDSDPSSPFCGLIRRITTPKDGQRVITDSALVKSIQRQINQPLGALASFRSVDGDSTDPNAMYELIIRFWSRVRDTFPEAWGLPTEQSRLMHSAGIEAVSSLMDFLAPRMGQYDDADQFIQSTLQAIAPQCAWTEGRWPDLNCAWNEVESTPTGIKRLTEQLVRLVQSTSLQQAA
jgi:DGQHR domain-containing protein